MPAIICPACNTRVFHDKYNLDINHDCTESTITSKRQEDRININDPDYNMAGSANKVFGKRAWIDGQNVQPRNRRGNKTALVTSRDRITHIDIEKRTFGNNPL